MARQLCGWVVLCICLGLTAGFAQARQAPPASCSGGPAAAQMSCMPGIDYPGGDLYGVDLPRAEPEHCRALCASNRQCNGFTYVRPGVQGPRARCWLKREVRAAVADASCCVSGVLDPAARSPQLRGELAARAESGNWSETQRSIQSPAVSGGTPVAQPVWDVSAGAYRTRKVIPVLVIVADYSRTTRQIIRYELRARRVDLGVAPAPGSPLRALTEAETPEKFGRWIVGPRAEPNAADYFLEVSNGGAVLALAGVVGPLPIAVDHDLVDSETQFIAVTESARQVDYSVFDANGDGRVDGTELFIVVIDNQLGGGSNRTPLVTDDGVEVAAPVVHVSANTGFYTLFHELGHSFPGMGTDLYGPWYGPGAVRAWGGQSCFNSNLAMMGGCGGEPPGARISYHFDPWSKVRLGWAAPDVVPVAALASGEVASTLIAPQSGLERPMVIVDPAHPNELYLIEYRNPDAPLVEPAGVTLDFDRSRLGQTGGPQPVNYDAQAVSRGVVVWHVSRKPGDPASADWRFIAAHGNASTPSGARGLAGTPNPIDIVMDMDGDTIPDRIEAGAPGRLLTPNIRSYWPAAPPDGVNFFVAGYGTINATNDPRVKVAGQCRGYTQDDGVIRLRWFDGTDAGVAVRIVSMAADRANIVVRASPPPSSTFRQARYAQQQRQGAIAGGDLCQMPVTTIDAQTCQRMCDDEPACRMWTAVRGADTMRPNYQQCWLKGGTGGPPLLDGNVNAISGLKSSPVPD